MDTTTSVLLEKFIAHTALPIWYENFNFWLVIVGVISVCLLCWYASETQKLRVEAQKTNKYSFRPVVVAKYISTLFNGSRELKMMNIGKGPALNIECRISQIMRNKGYTNLKDINANEKFNNLATDEKQTLRKITTIDQYIGAQGSEFSHGLRDIFAIIFVYEDVSKSRYQTVTLIEVMNGTPVIKRSIAAEYNSGRLKNII
ncbi:MAG: hypothetical protein Q8O88_05715 [bacterium]|nr:hypothetical protein [bacterium]